MLNLLLKSIFIVVAFSTTQTAFPVENSTFFGSFTSTNSLSDSPDKFGNPGEYGGSEFYDFPAKPPYGQAGFAELCNTFWLVPVLRYLITVNGDSIQLGASPVTTLLPVILLAATTPWWFHGQQVIDLMHDNNEVVVGDPVYIEEVTDGGDSDHGASKTTSPDSVDEQQDSCQAATSPKTPAASTSSESDRRDDKDDDTLIHLCGGQPCPACHYESCHCQKCSVATAPVEEDPETGFEAAPVVRGHKRRNEASGEEPPEKKSKAEDEDEDEDDNEIISLVRTITPLSGVTHVALLLRERAITGHLYFRLNPILAQAELGERGPVTPELEFTAHFFNRHAENVHEERRKREFSQGHLRLRDFNVAIKAVIPIKNDNFLSWAEDGIKIWSLQGATYLANKVPVAPLEVENVFVIQNDHIIVWFANGVLEDWDNTLGFWRDSNMASNICLAEQFPNNQLVTFSFSSKNISLCVWNNDQYFLSYTEIPCPEWLCRLTDIVVVSDTRFMTVTSVRNERETGGIHNWCKEGDNWVPEAYYKPSPLSQIELTVCRDRTVCILEKINFQTFTWTEHSQRWLCLPILTPLFFIKHGGVLPDGRLYIRKVSEDYHWASVPMGSLVSLSEGKDEWHSTIVHYCEQSALCEYQAIEQLNDGRLVVAIYESKPILEEERQPLYETEPILEEERQPFMSTLSIRLYSERGGKWSFVIIGYTDSHILGMTIQDENRLITWHEDNSIKIWSLYP